MAGRPRRYFYTFISNAIGEYYSCSYSPTGEPLISKNASPVPLKRNPSNLLDMRAELATNNYYKSLHRSITYPFIFPLDGASILRHLDYTTNGFETTAYLTIVKYNPERGIYELYYIGRFDFSKKKDNPKTGYTINTVDSSAWGVLSQRDDIRVQINCSATNPKAIKVLFDGINLLAQHTFQPIGVQSMNLFTLENKYLVFPLVKIATDGDSFGIVTEDQNYDYFSAVDNDLDDYTKEHNIRFSRTQYATHIKMEGTIEFVLTAETSGTFGLHFFYWRSTDLGNIWDAQYADRRLFFKVWRQNYFEHDKFETVTFPIDADFDLETGESVSFICFVENLSNPGGFQTNEIQPIITPVVRNIVLKTKTIVQPTTAYALRSLDLAQQIVEKVTGGLFTIDSEHYKTNNKTVLTCGNALRQEPTAFIITSFRDWYKSHDCGDFLAMRVIDGGLWVEKFDEVYKQDDNILDIGEISDIEIEQDLDHIVNSVEIGSSAEDYRRSSGKLEFNQLKHWNLDVKSLKNVLSLVSIYRRDGYGAEFIRLDYLGESSKDNSGDTDVFMIAITDELGEATSYLSNFAILTVDNAPLAPIITSPNNNDVITYPSPVIRGKAPAGSTVNIYVDTIFDGSVVSDANGKWSYNLVAVLQPYDLSGLGIVSTGVHVINATFTDETGDLATVTVTITTGTTPIAITYPLNGDFIVNNKPLIKGIGQRGQLIDVFIDGILIGIVSVDNSCKWEIQSPVLHNGAHIISANILQSLFSVGSTTEIPIITTYFEQFVEINNLPLVEGVAKPGTVVFLYLDYYRDIPVGSATADVNGNWAIQLIPLIKADGVTTLTPIPNGEHTLSTGLIIQNTPIQVSGYKLDRPNFDEVAGVTDNTVFNVPLSPKRMLLAWRSYFASIMVQNKDTWIEFGGGEKNNGLSTTIGNSTIRENSNVLISSLGAPSFLPITASFKTKVPLMFNKVFNFFNHGGTIRASNQGNELFFIPMGRMSVEDVSNDVQTWKLLFSTKNSLITLLNLFRNGLTLKIMQNAVHHSDYNSLHFVKYDHTIESKYHSKEIYDDWFDFRNERWISRPIYLQKFQTNDVIRDQIITNGVSDATLIMYRCSDAVQVGIFPYNPVTPTPIPAPDVVQEVEIDFSFFPEDQYFFVMMAAGNPIGISERVETRADWEKTILFECYNTTNLTGFMFSTGIKSILRVEGLITKWQPDIVITANKDEVGDNYLLRGVHSKRRKILIGDGRGLPDYLYLKASAFVILDTMFCEGILYVANKENKFQEVDRIIGHPMYHYELDVELAKNELGITMGAGLGADLVSVVLTVDDEAFGYGGGGLVDIKIDNE